MSAVKEVLRLGRGTGDGEREETLEYLYKVVEDWS